VAEDADVTHRKTMSDKNKVLRMGTYSTLCVSAFYSSRNADEIGNRAARMAGNRPPIKPIDNA